MDKSINAEVPPPYSPSVYPTANIQPTQQIGYGVQPQPIATPIVVNVQPNAPYQMGQGVQPATVVVITKPESIKSRTPCTLYCPKCQQTVTSTIEYKAGVCWWIICFVGFFVACWPLLFCLCCNSSKDVVHSCPHCRSVIAVAKK